MDDLDLPEFQTKLREILNLPPDTAARYLEALAPLVNRMAQTGLGTTACLETGCLPLPVHFYSPVPDLNDLRNRRIWEKQSTLHGIAWNTQEQLAFLEMLGHYYGSECRWPAKPIGDPNQFYTENNSFSFGCAAITHCLIRYAKPRRLMEIGSGFSSQVIDEALMMNRHEGSSCQYTVIDPYPASQLHSGLNSKPMVREERVELVDPEFVSQLQANDILFIDSGHTVRSGGDVNFLILDVLPRLSEGVMVHFHDIPMPYEYPESYFTNPGFRVFWTESYLLQAFLCLNPQYRILLAVSDIFHLHRDDFQNAFRYYDPVEHRNASSSFWIQRVGRKQA